MKPLSLKITSGGQTGADRGALDFALAYGLPHGGWCPQGRKAEDGPIPRHYLLTETPSPDPAQRTEWNVRDTDGTVVFSIAPTLTGGSRKTALFAETHLKPLLHLVCGDTSSPPERVLLEFIRVHRIRSLNIGGPKASEEPGVESFVRETLCRMWDTAVATSVPSPATLATPRLRLRPLTSNDAPTVARLAGRREIADMTLSIPHPYSEAQACEWIAAHAGDPTTAGEFVMAITVAATDELIGATGLRGIDFDHWQAELGFWIGVDHWGHGYATEAAGAVVRHGFETLNLNRLYAHHLVRNPASGRVLEKLGMRREGLLRQATRKWGRFEDVVSLALLRADWEAQLR
jgi:[ribosomal protein S5]-alanine N-acetyltransferase